MTHLRRSAVLMMAALFLVTAGCSGGPKLYPVKGKVEYEGKPMVGGGSISFLPLDNRPGPTAGGEILEDGTFTLMTKNPADGCTTGEFRVIIYQSVEKESGTRNQDGEKGKVKAALSVPAADRIPTIYADAQKSPLKATVEAKEMNNITLTLKKQ